MKGINQIEIDLSFVKESTGDMFYKDPDSNMYKCKHCTRITTVKHHMQEHVTIHVEGLVFICLKCRKTHIGIQTFRQHMKKYHDFTVSTGLKRVVLL